MLILIKVPTIYQLLAMIYMYIHVLITLRNIDVIILVLHMKIHEATREQAIYLSHRARNWKRWDENHRLCRKWVRNSLIFKLRIKQLLTMYLQQFYQHLEPLDQEEKNEIITISTRMFKPLRVKTTMTTLYSELQSSKGGSGIRCEDNKILIK